MTKGRKEGCVDLALTRGGGLKSHMPPMFAHRVEGIMIADITCECSPLKALTELSDEGERQRRLRIRAQVEYLI